MSALLRVSAKLHCWLLSWAATSRIGRYVSINDTAILITFESQLVDIPIINDDLGEAAQKNDATSAADQGKVSELHYQKRCTCLV
jgi:hypothetical protein